MKIGSFFPLAVAVKAADSFVLSLPVVVANLKLSSNKLKFRPYLIFGFSQCQLAAFHIRLGASKGFLMFFLAFLFQ